MKDLPSKDIVFEQGTPFTPLLQLLSVLPPQSAGFLPPSYQQVMTDGNSPVVDYYPKDFEVDANGKKNSWECIVRIPFINEQLLVDTVSTIDHRQALTESERMRNVPGEEHAFLPAEPQGRYPLCTPFDVSPTYYRSLKFPDTYSALSDLFIMLDPSFLPPNSFKPPFSFFCFFFFFFFFFVYLFPLTNRPFTAQTAGRGREVG